MFILSQSCPERVFLCSPQVFQAEYNLVCDITNSPLPYIALCDGVWMGLGVGIAAHGDIRIVTEKTLFAMPENAIGLWPDVGFALLAAHAPGTSLRVPETLATVAPFSTQHNSG
jgi:enoyl-CoA hydratase/carnithine racemase